MNLGERFVAGSVLWIGAASACAAVIGDPVAGQKKSVVCQGCHGVKGVSTDPSVPKLAGQFREYLARQISEFQVQNRRDERMSPMADTITKTKDLMDIAAYFASQPKMRGAPSKSPATALGRSIYEKGMPERGLDACISCHGEAGKGSLKQNPAFPVIGGQHKQYILKQLTDFRTNKRTTDPTGFMSNIARVLTKPELDAVAEYVSSL